MAHTSCDYTVKSMNINKQVNFIIPFLVNVVAEMILVMNEMVLVMNEVAKDSVKQLRITCHLISNEFTSGRL